MFLALVLTQRDGSSRRVDGRESGANGPTLSTAYGDVGRITDSDVLSQLYLYECVLFGKNPSTVRRQHGALLLLQAYGSSLRMPSLAYRVNRFYRPSPRKRSTQLETS